MINKKLCPEAIMFIGSNVKKVPSLTCPECGTVVSTKIVKQTYKFDSVQTNNGEYSQVSMSEYTLNDGRVARETIQTVEDVGKNDMIVFLSLTVGLIDNGRFKTQEEYAWSDSEISVELGLYYE